MIAKVSEKVRGTQEKGLTLGNWGASSSIAIGEKVGEVV